MKLVFSFLPLFILSACGSLESIDRRADVITVKNNGDKEELRLQAAKMKAIQKKQSLRLALLDLKLKNNKKNIIIDSNVGVIYRGVDISDKNGLANLYRNLFPELGEIFNLVSEQSLRLSIVCHRSFECDLFRENMSPQTLRRTRFIKSTRLRKIASIKPEIVLSNKPEYFDKLKRYSYQWEKWKANWYKVGDSDATSLLKAEEWANLLPAVNEF